MIADDQRQALELIAAALRGDAHITDVEVIADDPDDLVLEVSVSHLGRLTLAVMG